ncbi:MAG: cyclic nucleotide-binding domain-containing protein [Pseudomonadota bacterium]
MDWLSGAGLGIGILVYLAFVLDLAGFLARDELRWRVLMLGASGLYLVYYYYVTDVPLWDAIRTNAALAAVNLAMIGVVVVERSTFAMRRDTRALYQLFPMLSPGQFRRLLRSATKLRAMETRVLTREGKTLDEMFFIVEGAVEVAKGQSVSVIEPGTFIGEIAYLTKQGASATVSIAQGTRYLRWSHSDLDAMTTRSAGLRVALVAHLNLDLARKVAASQPVQARA